MNIYDIYFDFIKLSISNKKTNRKKYDFFFVISARYVPLETYTVSSQVYDVLACKSKLIQSALSTRRSAVMTSYRHGGPESCDFRKKKKKKKTSEHFKISL